MLIQKNEQFSDNYTCSFTMSEDITKNEIEVRGERTKAAAA